MIKTDSNVSKYQPAPEKFYTAIITEEKSGRKLPRIPIKLMGENPLYIGKRIASLVQSRFSNNSPCDIEVMPNGKLVSILLTSSYLLIKFEPPSASVKVPKRQKAFAHFIEGIQLGMSSMERPLSTKNPRRKASHF